MSSFDYDLFVIGAGSGGVRAARMSAALGARVAIAEDRYLGGTCVNVGCVPKKLFVYASHFAEDFEIARSFGWSFDNKRFDWPTLIRNKDREIARLNDVYRRILENNGVTLVNGRAVLVDAHNIDIDGKKISAERILVATGGWPDIPEIPGREHVISSNEAFHLDRLPERIAIVGGGYIAVEFAGIFHGMGVDTTLIYRGPLFMRGFDTGIRERLATEMRHQGIRLIFDNNLNAVEKTGDSLSAVFTDGSTMEFDTIMYATGRKPNTANLGLEHVGVQLNERGAIEVNEHYQTSVPSIYAVGDVTDRINLTPVALAEGMFLARELYGKPAEAIDYDLVPTAVFSQPNIGTVGLTEDEARTRYGELDIYQSAFRPMKLSLSESEEKTFMKMIVERGTDRVLGVHMLGQEAGEIIQGIAIALRAGATKSTFDTTIGIHPTSAEEFVTMREPVADV